MLIVGRLLAAPILFLFAIPVLTLCQQAQAAAEQVSSFDYLGVDIKILSNSDMEITEKQKYSFMSGTFHYGYRWIPLDEVESIDGIQVSEDGQPYVRDPAVKQWIENYKQSGESPAGNNYAYDSWIEDNELWIVWWYPETIGGSRAFEIKYVVHGGMLLHNDGDQLYWAAIFGNRDKAIGRTKVTVHLPEPVSSTQLIVDSFGMEAQTSIVDDTTIEFTTGSVLDNAGLTIRVIIPHGIINSIPFNVQQPRGVGEWIVDKVSTMGIISLCLVGLGVFLVLGGTFWLVVNRRRRGIYRNSPGYRD